MAVRKSMPGARRWARITQVTLGVGMLLWSGSALASQGVISAVNRACAGQQMKVNVNDCALCHGNPFATNNPSNMFFSDSRSGFYDTFCVASVTDPTSGTGTGTGSGTGTGTNTGTGSGTDTATGSGSGTGNDTGIGSAFDDDGDDDGGRTRFRRASRDDDMDDGGFVAAPSATEGDAAATAGTSDGRSRREWGHGRSRGDSHRSDRQRHRRDD